MKSCINLCAVCLVLISGWALSEMITFDGLTDYTSGTLHYGGTGTGAAGFTAQGVYFPQANDDYSWSGASYSKENDTATHSFTNQFSAVTGQDVSETGNYCVGAGALKWWDDYSTLPVKVSFDPESAGVTKTVTGVYITNTTYAALDMLNGSPGFSKQFGGATGSDADWFLLTITGKDSTGGIVGSTEFYLADYRFADNGADYIVDTWEYVDLSSLGAVSALEFALTSSDIGDYGMNTPAYFAMDNLAFVPEPATLVLLGLGMFMTRRK